MKTLLPDDKTLTPPVAGARSLQGQESARLDQAAAMIQNLFNPRRQVAKVTRLVLVPFVLPWPTGPLPAGKYRRLMTGRPRAGSTRDTLGRLQAQYWRRICLTRLDRLLYPELAVPSPGSPSGESLHPIAALLQAPRVR
ncbi:hypothetical protein [Chitinimonas naiadis]